MNDAWKIKPLGKIITLQRGFDLPTQSRSDGEIAVIGSNGIVGFHGLAPKNVPIPGLMLGRSGSVGEITIWNEPYWPLNTVLYVKDFHGNDPLFLSYWLRLFPFKQYAEGVSVPTLNRNSINDVPFPLPEFDDQLKISMALTAVEINIDFNSKALLTARELKRAAMRELFTRGLRGEAQKGTEIGLVPESWDVVPLGLLGRVGNGSTPKKSIPEYWNGGTYPWLTSAKVYDREIIQADKFVTDVALRECHLPRVEPGAILIAITGQGKTLGHCAVLRMQATINQHIAYVATDTSRADPSFVRGYLETQYDYLRQVGSGGGSTKGALTCAFLRGLPIPFPLLNEQREIVEVLDAIDRKIDLHQRKRTVLEDLFKALLHKLMTGEIRVADLDLSALGNSPMEGVAA